MKLEEKVRAKRPLKGVAYTLEEFAAKYKLPQDEARSIFVRFGPSSVDLDVLMMARSRRGKASELLGI